MNVRFNVEMFNAITLRERFPENFDPAKYLKTIPYETECRIIADNRPVDVIWISYNSDTGKIEPPKFDAREGEYSLLLVRIDGITRIIDPNDPNAQLRAAFSSANITLEIDDKKIEIIGTGAESREYTHEIMTKVIPERIMPVSRLEWETNPFGKQLRATHRKPDKFGNRPGDETLINSIIEYNSQLSRRRFGR